LETRRALHRSREPSALSFVLKIHLQPTRGDPDGRWVKVLVLFERRSARSNLELVMKCCLILAILFVLKFSLG